MYDFEPDALNFEERVKSQQTVATEENKNSVEIDNNVDIDLGPQKKISVVLSGADNFIRMCSNKYDDVDDMFKEDPHKNEKYLNYMKRNSKIKEKVNSPIKKKKSKVEQQTLTPRRSIQNILTNKRSVDLHGQEIQLDLAQSQAMTDSKNLFKQFRTF